VIAFVTWGQLFKKAIASGSFKKGLQYFVKPPGWSHDGSTKTTRQLISEHNQLHPDKTIE